MSAVSITQASLQGGVDQLCPVPPLTDGSLSCSRTLVLPFLPSPAQGAAPCSPDTCLHLGIQALR